MNLLRKHIQRRPRSTWTIFAKVGLSRRQGGIANACKFIQTRLCIIMLNINALSRSIRKHKVANLACTRYTV
jgi:hypothetical protein